jgi:hypothetical protein
VLNFLEAENEMVSIHRFIGLPTFILNVKNKPEYLANGIENHNDKIENFKINVNSATSKEEHSANVF